MNRSSSSSSSDADATPASDTAGTVQSFTGRVLTLARSDGSTVSGKVTDTTEIGCEAAETEAVLPAGDRTSGGNGSDGGGGE